MIVIIKKAASAILTLSFLIVMVAGVVSPAAAEETKTSAVEFVDVPEDVWFREYVDFVSSRGIMGGDGRSDTFLPHRPTTRGMLAVILNRLEDEPKATKKPPFTDLRADWYSKAVGWAWESEIVNGTGDKSFTPDGIITRQQMVTMLYRYAKQKLYPTDRAKGDLSVFEDGNKVAPWAHDAVAWALGEELVLGRSKTQLAPDGNTTRCEMATILTRFLTKYENSQPSVDPLYEKAEALGSSPVCAAHGAALHAQLGSPGDLSEEELGAYITDHLGLDRSIYRFALTGGGFPSFLNEYSKLGLGDGALIPVSFEIKNIRTTGDPAPVVSFPLYVIRNDFISAPHTVRCENGKIADETLSALAAEFDPLFVCGEDGCVHVEADSLEDKDLADALLALTDLDREIYSASVSGDGVPSLISVFDALPVGGVAPTREVTLKISNESIKGKCGYDSECLVTVRVSVLKTDGDGVFSVPCPYEEVRRAYELFEKKYVCGEHNCAHIALNHEGEAAASDIGEIMKDALDLCERYEVNTVSDPSGGVTVSVTDARGYRHGTLLFKATYCIDRSSSVNARFIMCENDRDAYKMIVQDGYDGATGYGSWNYGQTESGWLLDTRADDSVRHGEINDVSTTESSQVIRPVNDTFKGVIEHKCSVTIKSGFDGAILDFRNDKEESVCLLQTSGNVWGILTPDGTLETVYEPGGRNSFVFDLRIDLYEETVELTINGEDLGKRPLALSGVNANVGSFRFASTDGDTVCFSMGLCETTVNYSLFELFSDQYLTDTLPAGWIAENAEFAPNPGISGSWDNHSFDGRLSVGGYAEKAFEETEGSVIARFSVLPSLSSTDTEYSIFGNGEKLVSLTADDGSFYVNGERAYDYVKNVWYRFCLFCDTETGSVKLKINGIDRGEYSLTATGVPFDTVRVESRGAEPVMYDEFYVYRDVSHGDYVPEPVRPAGEEEYTVGINTCTMWLNGFHGGWACITPFDDTKPVLGFYDEGNPETADWEIKYLVEHGVDFQSFVSLGLEDSGPVTTGLGWHLEDGYKLAKYSDMMKYCLNWCSGSPFAPGDLESWKTYYVPYLIEHHFKDPRYMVIDNMPLLTFFQFILPGSNPYWTTENRKAAFDYLEEQVKKLGFDGIILLEVDWASNEQNAAEGIDGVYSYNFGKGFAVNGSFETITKETVLRENEKAKSNGLTYVPTVSTGFNSIGWMDPRSPVMSADEFYDCNEWIRDEFFRLDPDAPSWARNLIILSTWNEYGEGTYIMPCEENYGFGYLDAIRELYTAEGVDESLDLIPTAAQLERINRLYPQYLKLIRAQEYEIYSNGVDVEKEKTKLGSEWVASIDPSSAVIRHDDNVTVSGGVISNDSGRRGAVTLRLDPGVDLSKCESVVLIAYLGNRVPCSLTYGIEKGGKVESLTSGLVYGRGVKLSYGIEISEAGAAGDALEVSMPAGMRIYGIRISCGTLSFFGNELTLSGADVPIKVSPELSERGDYLFGFDTIFTDLHPFGIFAEWNEKAGSMTLSLPGDVYVFTVGSEFYTLNGTRYYLGYEIHENDGVPMIPLNIIAERAGYRIDFSDMRHAVIEKGE